MMSSFSDSVMAQFIIMAFLNFLLYECSNSGLLPMQLSQIISYSSSYIYYRYVDVRCNKSQPFSQHIKLPFPSICLCEATDHGIIYCFHLDAVAKFSLTHRANFCMRQKHDYTVQLELGISRENYNPEIWEIPNGYWSYY